MSALLLAWFFVVPTASASASADAVEAWKHSRATADDAATDPLQALVLAAGACEGGLVPACFAEQDLWNARSDKQALASQLAPRCASGEDLACTLAWQADRWSRDEALEPICARGDARACRLQARAAFDGSSFDRDLATALSASQRACELGSSLACTRLTLMYQVGLGVSVDVSAAEHWAAQVCRPLQANACRQDTVDPQRPAPVVRDISAGETLVARLDSRDSVCLVAVRIDRYGAVERSIRLDCDKLLRANDMDPRHWRFLMPDGVDVPAHALVPFYLVGD